MQRTLLRALTIFFLVSAPCVFFGQNLTGELDGVVRDTSGAAIPNANVTITNTDTKLVIRKLTTTGQGTFSAPLLNVGNYSIKISAPGFATAVVDHAEVHVNTKSAYPVSLTIGQTSQTVDVSASAVAPEMESSASATLLKGSEIRQLSLSSRNYQQLLSLQPGVSGPIPGTVDRGIVASSGSYNQANFQVNGQRPTQNDYFLDGSDMANHGGNLQTGGFPSIDAIQEVNTTRSGYGAQYGGSGSAVVSLQTRAGTSAFHGGAYEFFRSQVLNANNYFSNLAAAPRPGIRYNDFGYSLGGPVWIPHVSDRSNANTFFFFTQEYLRSETQTTSTFTNVPTALQRQGTFGAPVCIAYSGAACTQSTTQISTFDGTAAAYTKDIINKLPLPNSPTDPQGLIVSTSGTNNETQTVIRIDHQFGSRLNVFFRYLDDPFHLNVPSGLPGVNPQTITDGGTNYLGHATFMLNPNTLFEGGYAYQAIWINMLTHGLITQTASPDIHPALPNPNTTGVVSSINVGGLSISGAGANYNPGNNQQGFLNATHTVGRHTLYFGGVFENIMGAQNNAGSNGQFTFSASALPAGSTATAFMQSYANFLRGSVATFSQPSSDTAIAVHEKLFEAYAQDDFKLSPRLTLNAGVRYTHIIQPTGGPFLGQSLAVTSFDPARYNPENAPTIGTDGLICTQAPCPGGATPNPTYDPLNGVIVGGKSSPYGKSINSTPNLNFAPRVGFAFDVFGNGKTSLRGGYGLYYIQTLLGITQNEAFNNPPFSQQLVIGNTSFDQPGIVVPATSRTPLVIYGNKSQWTIPYTQSWSLDVQQQFSRNGVVDIGYYANKGTHLLGAIDLNQPQPGAYTQQGIIPGNVVTTANSTLLNQIRPYKGYGNMNYIEPIFKANYNALQISVKQQFSGDSQIGLNYTWSKALANSLSDRSNPPQNIYNLNAEYGPTAYNRTNLLNLNFVYELPFFHSQQGIVGRTLGGWETTGIISAGSGLPMTASTINVDPGGLGLLVGGGPARPDFISSPNQGAQHQLKSWFNKSAFALVPSGQYRPGNSPVGNILGPEYQTWDLSLFKNFHVVENAVFQLRGEAFNTFNHTNFSSVSTTLGNSNYGQVTGAGQARVLQIAAKLSF